MSNKKQTAVDWIAHKLSSLNWDYLVGGIDNKTFNIRYDEILTKAKQMEKEQIVNALQYGFHTEYVIGSLKYINQELEQYYKDNYEQ